FGASVDHRAVRVTSGESRQLAGFDRHDRLVQQRHAVAHLAEVDEHAALTDASEGDELAMGEPGADLPRVHEVAVGTGQVAGLEDAQHASSVFDIAGFDTVDARILEQPGGPVDPAAAATDIALEAETLGELDAEVRGPMHLTPVCAELVRAHPVR